jgi:hypothetical protein
MRKFNIRVINMKLKMWYNRLISHCFGGTSGADQLRSLVVSILESDPLFPAQNHYQDLIKNWKTNDENKKCLLLYLLTKHQLYWYSCPTIGRHLVRFILLYECDEKRTSVSGDYTFRIGPVDDILEELYCKITQFFFIINSCPYLILIKSWGIYEIKLWNYVFKKT